MTEEHYSVFEGRLYAVVGLSGKDVSGGDSLVHSVSLGMVRAPEADEGTGLGCEVRATPEGLVTIEPLLTCSDPAFITDGYSVGCSSGLVWQPPPLTAASNYVSLAHVASSTVLTSAPGSDVRLPRRAEVMTRFRHLGEAIGRPIHNVFQILAPS